MVRTFLVGLALFGCGPSTPKQQTSVEPPPAPERTTTGSTAAEQQTPSACQRSDPFGPFELSGEEMLRRRGLGDRLFSDTVSSAEAPIQVCGVSGELAWLTNVTCADGSKPWGSDLRKAHQARKGSSTGQRACGKTVEPVAVDHYQAPCPEKQYDIYLDMYECGPGERFQ